MQADAILEIRDPDGLSADILLEVKIAPLEPRLVADVASRLRGTSLTGYDGDERPDAAPVLMVVSPYLSPLARDRLAKAGISYVDSTGNMRLTVDRPAVFIETQGADKNPFREERPLRSLRGARSARAARALMDYRPPFGTRELAAETASSPSMISRVAGLLEPDEIVTRDGPRGRIVSVDWEALARRWAGDYEFATSRGLTTWLEPRGARALLGRLRDATFRYAVTGSFAANRLAPVAEPRLVALFADDPVTAADSLGLRPADTGGNVLVVNPFDAVVFERAESDDGITYARVTQVLLDLMKGPGRGPAEADALMEWMRDNEELWKLSMTEAG
ncbi:MAG: hypothetical protein F4Z17_12900 [Acidimicrobiia bacterium]|nr:hypothetical protein [Acidimicrobiia bacterium]